MSAGLEDLLHEAAVLHRFVGFIEEYCRQQERSQTYVDASGLFFDYVKRLADGIKQHLVSEVTRARRFPSRLPVLRRHTLTLKYYLSLLHSLIKPAADAHTLTIPAPLIDLASKQLRQVHAMEASNIVILLTPELMYFQRPHTDIKNQAYLVESFIPQASFPPKLGFIELPYSQGTSFFTNLAIYHEVGHFVYEELSVLDPPLREYSALKTAISRSLNKVFGRSSSDQQARAFVSGIVEDWTQEIFCDLFALRLLGPAFSLALVEMLGMLGFLSRPLLVTFNPTHPAPACRFAEHINLLDGDSWLSAIKDIKPDQMKLLERLARIRRSDYKFYLDEKTRGPTSLVYSFLDIVVPTIRRLAKRVTPDTAPAVKRFKKLHSSVEDCLRAGVVPHTRYQDEPDPVSIINAAFCFYLTSLPKLLKRFEAGDAQDSVEKHSLWAERLENWTMKAVEDSQVQARFRKVQRYGPF